MFYCTICKCHEHWALGYEVPGCRHTFCRSCLARLIDRWIHVHGTV